MVAAENYLLGDAFHNTIDQIFWPWHQFRSDTFSNPETRQIPQIFHLSGCIAVIQIGQNIINVHIHVVVGVLFKEEQSRVQFHRVRSGMDAPRSLGMNSPLYKFRRPFKSQ